jgi:hypothetical protein
VSGIQESSKLSGTVETSNTWNGGGSIAAAAAYSSRANVSMGESREVSKYALALRLEARLTP